MKRCNIKRKFKAKNFKALRDTTFQKIQWRKIIWNFLINFQKEKKIQNSITFVLLIQKLQASNHAHHIIKGFLMVPKV
jgi:hypothetical protein